MEGESAPMAKHPQQLYFDNVSPATRLLEKRRQMYEVQDALENQKARYARDEEQFKKKEDSLQQKDLQLQHQLVRFNKFLQDNEAKRRRAETRAQEEAAQIRQKEDEIRDLEKQLEESRQYCEELADEVTRNMKYEEFLEEVKNTGDEYNEIQDLVTRYETLEGANKDLMEDATTSEAQIEDMRKAFSEYRRRAEMEMLEMNNRVSDLQSELDQWQKERVALERSVDEATQEDSRHSLHFGRILMSVENLFLRCTTKRKNIQHALELKEEEGTKGIDARASSTKGMKGKDDGQLPEGDDSFRRKQQLAIRQLNVILNYLKDFKDITEKLKHEKRSNQPTQRQVEFEREPEIQMRMDEAPKQGSQTSGSQTNTKELPRSAQPSAVLNPETGA